MSESVPPAPPQPAETPNPLEIFYEQHKTKLWGLVGVLVVFLGYNYVSKEMKQGAIDARWTSFNEQTNLDDAVTKKVEFDLSMAAQMGPQYKSMLERNIISGALSRAQADLLAAAEQDLENADAAQIQKAIDAARKEKAPTEAWLLWVAAQKARFEENWDAAESRAKELKERFPKHILCVKSRYPVQVREETPASKEKRKEEENQGDDPELEKAVEGSMVDLMLAAIQKDRNFRKENAKWFEAPEPDKSETVVLKIEGGESGSAQEVEIAFYPDAAPQHIAAFKKAVGEKYYDGIVIHEVVRKGKDSPFSPATRQAKTLHFGLAATKTETDRTKWIHKDEDSKDEDMLEWEAKKPLSFFPGMLAAEVEKNGKKSSARRMLICANDGAVDLDGRHVIFGRVIRGMELIEEIANASFVDEASEQSGKGRLSRDYKIATATLKKTK